MEVIVGRDFIVTNSASATIGVQKRTIGKKFSIGPKAARFVAVIIFGALGLLYLTQSTQGADRSYQVRDLTNQESQLSEQRDQLQIEASRLQSLNEIDKTVNPTAPVMQAATAANVAPSLTK